MSKFGPSRAEYRFRLVVSLFGLAATGGAMVVLGTQSLAAFEVLGLATLFFAGSAIWSARALWKG